MLENMADGSVLGVCRAGVEHKSLQIVETSGENSVGREVSTNGSAEDRVCVSGFHVHVGQVFSRAKGSRKTRRELRV